MEILRVAALRKYYPLPGRGRKERYARANESITFAARQGEIVALVGESGSGKSTVAKVVVGLETATGEVVWQGEDVARRPVTRRTLAQRRLADGLPASPRDPQPQSDDRGPDRSGIQEERYGP